MEKVYARTKGIQPDMVDGFCPGCMHSTLFKLIGEVLEEMEFQPMFDACKNCLGGKAVALFGSYGWGDGEWMRTWESDCDSAGVNLVCESVICTETPDDAALRLGYLGAAYRVNKVVIVGLAAILSHSLLHLLELALLLGLLLLDLLGFLFVIL